LLKKHGISRSEISLCITAEKFLSPKKAETKHCIQKSVGKLFLAERKQTSNKIYTEELVL
jgi:hypothetical protein